MFFSYLDHHFITINDGTITLEANEMKGNSAYETLCASLVYLILINIFYVF